MDRDIVSDDAVGSAGTDRGTLLAVVLMVLFAGGNAVAIRISNLGLPPLWGAALRGGGRSAGAGRGVGWGDPRPAQGRRIDLSSTAHQGRLLSLGTQSDNLAGSSSATVSTEAS